MSATIWHGTSALHPPVPYHTGRHALQCFCNDAQPRHTSLAGLSGAPYRVHLPIFANEKCIATNIQLWHRDTLTASTEICRAHRPSNNLTCSVRRFANRFSVSRTRSHGPESCHVGPSILGTSNFMSSALTISGWATGISRYSLSTFLAVLDPAWSGIFMVGMRHYRDSHTDQ